MQPVECQIFLVVEVGPGSSDRLAAACEASPIASVLFKPGAAGTLTASAAKPLVDIAQKYGVAALIADDPSLARVLRADGVHLGPGADLLSRYETAREILGRGGIVGVDAGGSRHLAMEAGEAGADYVAFGRARIKIETAEEGSTVHGGAEETPTVDLVAWWSEIFEVPCVALDAADIDDLREFRRADADFVAVAIPQGLPVADVTKVVRDARSELDARA